MIARAQVVAAACLYLAVDGHVAALMLRPAQRLPRGSA